MSVQRRNLYSTRLEGEESWQTISANSAKIAATLEACTRHAAHDELDFAIYSVEVRDNGVWDVRIGARVQAMRQQ